MGKKRRVFLGTRDVAGFYESIEIGFKRLGIKCDYYCLAEHHYKYATGNKSKLAKLHRMFMERFLKTNNRVIKIILRLFSFLIRFVILIKALLNYDVFVFLSGGYIFKSNEYPIYRIFRKKTIFIYCGTDCRPAYLNGATALTQDIISNILMENDVKKYNVNVDAIYQNCLRIKADIKRVEKYADYILNIYPQAIFQNRDFISLVAVGWPYEFDSVQNQESINEGNKVRILHAPTRVYSKGTAIIRNIIDELKEKGLNIEYIEITNCSHQEVIDEIRRCDIVVDEVYSDTSLGALGTEAAFFKKPVVVGGYYADYIFEEEQREYIAPNCFCHPAAMKDEIEKYVLNPALRHTDGEKLYQYFIENRKPEKVAEKILMIAEGTFPKEWLCKVNDMKYFYGYGLRKDIRDHIIRTMIKEKGVESLCVSDNKIIEKRILDSLN